VAGVSNVPFWRCYYHIIWTTKNREARITPQIEPVILKSIQEKAEELESPILAINTVPDHIHIAACIPPKLAIADCVKLTKGTSSRGVNSYFPDLETAFYWEQRYGVLTFGAKNSQFVVDYIRRQKEHHANSKLEAYLEQIDDDN
jgi:REP element-mobilizing transposase RayT